MKRKILHAITHALVPPFRRKYPPSKEVAILVPLSTRSELTEEELISMRQLEHYLGDYDKFLIAPEGLELNFENYRIKRFKKMYFGSAAAHGRLLNHPSFYREFEDYKFVFFYHLDSLAFSDQLQQWCQTDLDYVGPPWIKCDDSPWVDRPRVGNGGFTLLRVESALKTFNIRYRRMPLTFWLDIFTHHAPLWLINLLGKIQKHFPNMELVNALMKEWREINDPSPNNRNNDVFWSDLAHYYNPEFKVATVEEGLRFAFEVSPKTCLEMNGGKLPFGCHAWAKYDRKFWEPLIVSATPPPRHAL